MIVRGAGLFLVGSGFKCKQFVNYGNGRWKVAKVGVTDDQGM
jgi:hypothetical protein